MRRPYAASQHPMRPHCRTRFYAVAMIIGCLVDGCACIVRICGDAIAARFLVVVQHSMLVSSYNKRSARKRFLMFPPQMASVQSFSGIIRFNRLRLDNYRRITTFHAAAGRCDGSCHVAALQPQCNRQTGQYSRHSRSHNLVNLLFCHSFFLSSLVSPTSYVGCHFYRVPANCNLWGEEEARPFHLLRK